MVSNPAKLLVPWINHHGLFIVNELRRIDSGRRELELNEGCRLFSCFLDFGLQFAMLATALGGQPRPETPPKVVNLKTLEPNAFQQLPKLEPSRQHKALEKRRRAHWLCQRVAPLTRTPPLKRRPRRLRVSLSWWRRMRPRRCPLSSQRFRRALWRLCSTWAAAAAPLQWACYCGYRTQTARPVRVQADQQRAHEGALRQASRQLPRRQAPRRPTSRNDQPFLSFINLIFWRLLLITFCISYAVRILSWFALISYRIFAIEHLLLGTAKPIDGILLLH